MKRNFYFLIFFTAPESSDVDFVDSFAIADPDNDKDKQKIS